MSRKKLGKLLFSGLPARIKEIRGFLTQKEFANRIGVTQGAVQKYENGVNYPGYGVLEKIAEFGEVTVEWLLRGEEARAPGLQDFSPEAYSATLTALETALLTEVIAAVEEVVKAERMKFSPPPKNPGSSSGSTTTAGPSTNVPTTTRSGACSSWLIETIPVPGFPLLIPGPPG